MKFSVKIAYVFRGIHANIDVDAQAITEPSLPSRATRGSLLPCMDVSVLTGSTKGSANLFLRTHSLTSMVGETVVFLFHSKGDEADTKALEKECKKIVQISILDTEGNPDQRLDGALKELNGLIKGFTKSGSITQVHALVGLVGADDTLRVSHAGTAEAYLIRGGSASQITEYSSGKPLSSFVHIASGALSSRDVIVFSTQRLLRAFTPAQLAQVAARPKELITTIKDSLETEHEQASLAVLQVDSSNEAESAAEPLAPVRQATARSRGRRSGQRSSAALAEAQKHGQKALDFLQSMFGSLFTKSKEWVGVFQNDLKDPKRKRRAHLILLAGTLAFFLVIWLAFNLTRFSQRSQTRAELLEFIEQIESEIQSAENRHLSGDIDEANRLLQLSEEKARQVMNNEDGLFRTEAYDLIDRIQSKHEEFNNILRLTPRVVVNLSAQNPNIIAKGFVGLGDGEFIVYDSQDSYRVLLNTIDKPERITDQEFIINATVFSRYGSLVYQTSNSGIIETINDQPTSMKTEDPSGWITGNDIETYLRFLYILSPENNQIYKYERLSNRYGEPSEYNLNGDLRGALDMAIDGNIYVLKQDGEILSLLRGEVQPFVFRRAPEGVVSTANKIFKVTDSNFYLLDQQKQRIVVLSPEDDNGEYSYLRQYVLEGEIISNLADLYVNSDESQLYILDEKRIYVIDLDTL